MLSTLTVPELLQRCERQLHVRVDPKRSGVRKAMPASVALSSSAVLPISASPAPPTRRYAPPAHSVQQPAKKFDLAPLAEEPPPYCYQSSKRADAIDHSPTHAGRDHLSS